MNPMKIRLINRDAGPQNIVIFQEPLKNESLFETLYPIAWKVIPLNSYQHQLITVHQEIQVWVKETTRVYDADSRGTFRESARGQLWAFTQQGDFSDLHPLQGEMVDGIVGCVNQTPNPVDIGVGRDDAPLMVKRRIPKNGRVQFHLPSFLYIAYVSELQAGELIKSTIADDRLFKLDLTDLDTVEVILFYHPRTGRKTWRAENRVLTASTTWNNGVKVF